MRKMNACCVCYEEETAETRLLKITDCQHRLCHSCYKTWLKQCERESMTVPRCPECKKESSVLQAMHVLGRSYEAAQPLCDRNEESLEHTLHTWLDENGCKQCAHCGVYIERVDGCDAIMCLCGYRFCWWCELTSCDCEHEDFYDNVRRHDTTEVPPIASKEELQDLKRFLQSRKEEVLSSESGSSEHGQRDEDNLEEEVVEDFKGIHDLSVFESDLGNSLTFVD